MPKYEITSSTDDDGIVTKTLNFYNAEVAILELNPPGATAVTFGFVDGAGGHQSSLSLYLHTDDLEAVVDFLQDELNRQKGIK